MPKVTHAEPHAAALAALGVPADVIARGHALGINWGSVLTILLPVLVQILEGLGKTTTAPPPPA